jgi:hypothetical protein
VRAHRGRPGGDGELEHAPRPRCDVVNGEAALRGARQTNRLRRRLGRARDAVHQERFVQMDVRLDETGRDEAPARFDRFASRCVRLSHGHDAPLGDRQVDRVGAHGQTTGL